MAKGNKRLEEDLDLFCIIKEHKHHHMYLKQLDEDIFKNDTFDLDSDSVEEEKDDCTNNSQKSDVV